MWLLMSISSYIRLKQGTKVRTSLIIVQLSTRLSYHPLDIYGMESSYGSCCIIVDRGYFPLSIHTLALFILTVPFGIITFEPSFKTIVLPLVCAGGIKTTTYPNASGPREGVSREPSTFSVLWVFQYHFSTFVLFLL